MFEQGTTFAVPAKKPGASRAPVHPRPDRQPRPIGELIAELESDARRSRSATDPTASRSPPVHPRPCSRRPRLARERGMDRVARALRGPPAGGMADRRMA